MCDKSANRTDGHEKGIKRAEEIFFFRFSVFTVVSLTNKEKQTLSRKYTHKLETSAIVHNVEKRKPQQGYFKEKNRRIFSLSFDNYYCIII